MLTMQPIDEGLFAFVGSDRRLTRFENMFQLPNGVCYNAYLILDQKTAVVDCADGHVAESFFTCIEKTLDGRPLDYIFCNHVEPDHCGTLQGLLLRHPEASLVVSPLGLQILNQLYFYDFTPRTIVSHEGDCYDLGEHVLETIPAPHVHWPEVTFTYEQKKGWLFTADAFGTFGVPHGLYFDDQVDFDRDWLDEARRYYTNIVGRQGAQVLKALKRLESKDVRGIFPVHGIGFRDPQIIAMMMDKYRHWASYEAEDPGVVICYGSMYENSAHTADELAFYLGRLGVRNIRVYDVSETDVSWIIANLFRFSHAVYVCNNYNTELYPRLDALMRELIMLNFSNHRYSLIGNGSWGGRGIPIAQEILSKGKNLKQVGEVLQFKSRPGTEDCARLYQLAETLAEDLFSIYPNARPK